MNQPSKAFLALIAQSYAADIHCEELTRSALTMSLVLGLIVNVMFIFLIWQINELNWPRHEKVDLWDQILWTFVTTGATMLHAMNLVIIRRYFKRRIEQILVWRDLTLQMKDNMPPT